MTTGMMVVFKCHIFVISIWRYLYLASLSNSLTEMFLSDILSGHINDLAGFIYFVLFNDNFRCTCFYGPVCVD